MRCTIVLCQYTHHSYFDLRRHNLGCGHDRGTDNACSSSTSNYGYRDPGAAFRDIMAYDCKSGQCDNNAGGGCSKVQMFSNIQYTHNGKAVGMPLANCAAKINSVRAQVAAYKVHKNTVGTCPTQTKAFKLALTLDNYPEEVTWVVKNSGGVAVVTGGPYDHNTQQGDIIEVDMCLPVASYTFQINDAYGDGICCGYGQGAYKIYWDGVLKASGGSYSSSDVQFFGAVCANYPNWYDSYGDNCSWYETNEDPGCPYWHDLANGGLGTPGQACCHCGGGNY
jgi:hypothetical protein